MKKRATKIIGLVLAILCLSVALCSCDLFSGGSDKSDGKTNAGSNGSTEKKVSFAEVEENYEKQEYKMAETTLVAGLSLFVKNASKEEEAKEEDVSKISAFAKSDIVRASAKNDSVAAVELKKEGDSGQVKGILSIVKNALSGKIPSLGASSKIDIDAVRFLAGYIDYIQAFFSEKLDLSMKMGRKDGTTNAIAEYEYRKDGAAPESGTSWYSIGDDFIASLFGINEVDVNFAGKILTTALFDEEKAIDKGSTRLESNGNAKYSFEFETNALHSFVDKISQKAQTEHEKEDVKGKAIKTLGEAVKKWIDVENSFVRFSAEVDKNKLPIKSQTNCVVTINIDRQTLINVLKALKESQIIDKKTSDAINTLAFILCQYTCSSDQKENNIGLQMSFTAEEKYSYGENDCSLSKYDQKLFVPSGEKADGRTEIEELFKKLSAEEIDNYLKEASDALGESGEKIIGEIKETVEKTDFITKFELKEVVKEILLKYLDNQEIGQVVKEALEKLFSEKK